MSAKHMGQVWELDLPESEAWVLMAYADHADHEGNNVWPSVGLIAWKTGYHERSVRRITAKLRDRKIMIPQFLTPSGSICYRLEFDHIPRKAPRTPKVNRIQRRATPCQIVRGDKLAPDTRVTLTTKGKQVIDRAIGEESSSSAIGVDPLGESTSNPYLFPDAFSADDDWNDWSNLNEEQLSDN